MSTLDQTIQQLFAKLAERKAKVKELKDGSALKWKTNGTFRLIGSSTTVNIQTAHEPLIEECAVHLSMYENALRSAGEQLGRELKSEFSGFPAADWFADFKKRLATIDLREEEKKLSELEQRLNGVLSPEERRRIEVEMLMKDLG